MKKLFGIALTAALLGLASPAVAQDTEKDDGTVKKVGKTIKKGAKKAGKGVKKGAKAVGNETAELATKGKANVTDNKSEEWEGPEGQTIYVDDGEKYYWVNEKGGRVFITADQLRPKTKKQDDQ